MPAYRRPRLPGATVFFAVALADRGATTLTDHIDALREAVRVTRAERPFRIDAWVVLPDHLHAIWTLPEGDAAYSVRWGAIKSRFSRSLDAGVVRPSHVARREKAIWQRRFWERHLRDDDEVATAIRYCWMNPVKHGFVDYPTEWPWSSIHRDTR